VVDAVTLDDTNVWIENLVALLIASSTKSFTQYVQHFGDYLRWIARVGANHQATISIHNLVPQVFTPNVLASVPKVVGVAYASDQPIT
jgi:hypothetical protein